MKDRIYTKRHRSSATTTWVKLEPGERCIIVRDDRHYRLGGQVDDVVSGRCLTQATEVAWCSVAQEWTYSGDPVVEVKP